MAEAPKNRQELLERSAKAAFGPADENTAPNWLFVDRATKVIEAIESLGLRIVPAELTQEMHDAMWEPTDMPWRRRCERAIAASPFAPEKDNG